MSVTGATTVQMPAPSDIALVGADSITAAIASDVHRASAALSEALTFLRLGSDHAKFVRNGFDVTQEALFREADAIAQEVDRIRAQFGALSEPVPTLLVAQFTRAALPIVRRLIQFKDGVARAIAGDITQQTLPADFVLHLQREADFFVGILNHMAGLPTPTPTTLQLQGPTALVPTIARHLLEVVPASEAVAANLAYTEFWGKHHEEHAEAIAIFLRPGQQKEANAVAKFRRDFQELRGAATTLQRQFSLPDFQTLTSDTLRLTGDWRQFLNNTQQAQLQGRLQANFTQRLTEHIRIETDILDEAVVRTQHRLQQSGAPVSRTAGAIYTGATPKAVLVS